MMLLSAMTAYSTRTGEYVDVNHLMVYGTSRIIENNLMTIISSRSGGAATMQYLCTASGTLCCMADNVNRCAHGVTAPNIVLSLDGLTPYFDSGNGAAGFDIQGWPCVGWPGGGGNPAQLSGCLFQPALDLTVTCLDGIGPCNQWDPPPPTSRAVLTLSVTQMRLAPGMISNPENLKGSVSFESVPSY